jgi:hypothetical protein
VGADPRLASLLQHLIASGFADVSGTRVSATLPVTEDLLNRAIPFVLPPNAPVRDLTIHPESDDWFTVRVKLARPDFLPPLKLRLRVEQQPDPPASAVIGFRIASLPGLMSLAGAALSLTQALPPGVRLEGDRLTVDLRRLLEPQGFAPYLQYVDRLHLVTRGGRFVVELGLRVDPPGIHG